jgi:hypothetical protein
MRGTFPGHKATATKLEPFRHFTVKTLTSKTHTLRPRLTLHSNARKAKHVIKFVVRSLLLLLSVQFVSVAFAF